LYKNGPSRKNSISSIIPEQNVITKMHRLLRYGYVEIGDGNPLYNKFIDRICSLTENGKKAAEYWIKEYRDIYMFISAWRDNTEIMINEDFTEEERSKINAIIAAREKAEKVSLTL
jgi:hypothetical protein